MNEDKKIIFKDIQKEVDWIHSELLNFGWQFMFMTFNSQYDESQHFSAKFNRVQFRFNRLLAFFRMKEFIRLVGINVLETDKCLEAMKSYKNESTNFLKALNDYEENDEWVKNLETPFERFDKVMRTCLSIFEESIPEYCSVLNITPISEIIKNGKTTTEDVERNIPYPDDDDLTPY